MQGFEPLDSESDDDGISYEPVTVIASPRVEFPSVRQLHPSAVASERTRRSLWAPDGLLKKCSLVPYLAVRSRHS